MWIHFCSELLAAPLVSMINHVPRRYVTWDIPVAVLIRLIFPHDIGANNNGAKECRMIDAKFLIN